MLLLHQDPGVTSICITWLSEMSAGTALPAEPQQSCHARVCGADTAYDTACVLGLFAALQLLWHCCNGSAGDPRSWYK